MFEKSKKYLEELKGYIDLINWHINHQFRLDTDFIPTKS